MSIIIDDVQVHGFEPTVRGVRNPMNSWEKSDSGNYDEYGVFQRVGKNDLALMNKLRKAGPDHGKFMRMIQVWVDITAPLYWWKQFDQYKVGVTTDSCSTMHKIHSKEFTLDDFSHEFLFYEAKNCLKETIRVLNMYRDVYLNGGKILGTNDIYSDPFEPKNKDIWWQMIQLLPSSYNQKRTVNLNYEVLHDIYHARKNHKLDEWHAVCRWIEDLPYSELITGKTEE